MNWPTLGDWIGGISGLIITCCLLFAAGWFGGPL
jgi:hypothetical protein